jgi:hypothetical protein
MRPGWLALGCGIPVEHDAAIDYSQIQDANRQPFIGLVQLSNASILAGFASGMGYGDLLGQAESLTEQLPAFQAVDDAGRTPVQPSLSQGFKPARLWTAMW